MGLSISVYGIECVFLCDRVTVLSTCVYGIEYMFAHLCMVVSTCLHGIELLVNGIEYKFYGFEYTLVWSLVVFVCAILVTFSYGV